jgi:cytidyltransferase-like protein
MPTGGNMTIHNEMYDEKENKTVMVSGGFDPVHAGHIRMIRDAANHGDVIIIANSDEWLFRKKGFVFMEWERRVEILNAIKGVILVDSVNDDDGTVCEAIKRHRPTYFANGGDRGRANTPEQSVCEEIGVKLLWGIGGEEKLQSSSELTKKARKFSLPPVRTSEKTSGR